MKLLEGKFEKTQVCHGQKSRFLGDGHPTFDRNPYNGYINHYYWVDEFIHPLLYGNNGSLDPGTSDSLLQDNNLWESIGPQ